MGIAYALIPAAGAAVGFYLMRHKSKEGKLLGIAGGVAAGIAAQSVIQNVFPGLPFFGTYRGSLNARPAYSLAPGTNDGSLVISGRQAGGQFIF